VNIFYDPGNDLVSFGVSQIRSSLQRQGIFSTDRFVSDERAERQMSGISVNARALELAPQSFRIERTGAGITIKGGDSAGALYGSLEWAERIAMGTDACLTEDVPIRGEPDLELRGVKFNLPFAPFESGDPFRMNEQTCLDLDFWKAFIDMLALNRYNCLSLWSEHPFHLMVVSPRFRAANPFDDVQVDRNIRLFRELMRHAAKRGIGVYLFTWNIRLLPEVARGLGLPEAVGDFGDTYAKFADRVGAPLNRFRQQSSLVKEYFREMMLQVLLTYPELRGIGTSASEWMDGEAYGREQWIADTYLEALQASGRRDVRFIHRTNMQTAGKEIKDLVQSQLDPERFYFSWKYSNAHCYSHPLPQFEQLWSAWDGVDLDRTQVLFTVRNDDVFTHRWGDPDYVRRYVRGMQKPYVKGFYWGSDGYVWGTDFQHIDYGHKNWRYDFERHAFEFQLWGRLSYNADTEDVVWAHLLESQYGSINAARFLEGIRSASRIIPAVNRLFWQDYDFQWHPESCLSYTSGFKTIRDFVDGTPMPGVGVLSLREFARREQHNALSVGDDECQESPPDIIHVLEDAADRTEAVVHELQQQTEDLAGGHAACTLLDLQAWVHLGRYYACKFSAALELNRYQFGGGTICVDRAVKNLEEAYGHWDDLGRLWILHNRPYWMARVKRTFGYPYYLEDCKRDIELARLFVHET